MTTGHVFILGMQLGIILEFVQRSQHTRIIIILIKYKIIVWKMLDFVELISYLIHTIQPITIIDY